MNKPTKLYLAAASLLLTAFTHSAHAQDSVGCSTLPASVDSLTSYSVTVPYVASDQRDVVVELWGSTWIGTSKSTVSAGSGNASITLNLPSAPPDGSSYLWKASIRPVGADWTQNLDLCQKTNVTIGTGGGGGGGGSSGGTGNWLESGGLVVMEAEHGTLVSNWAARPTNYGTDATMAGSSGDGWLEWTGAQYSGLSISPSSGNAVIKYSFEITTPGDYIFRWRSKQYSNVSAGDAGNDTFVRFASGTAVSGYQDFSNFTKVWVQSKPSWSWATSFEPAQGVFYAVDKARRTYAAGTHSIELAARSPGHSIDRLVLHRTSVAFNESNFTSLPESQRAGGSGSSLVYMAATDFPAINGGQVPYYVDTARNALAINAATVSYRDKFARATTTFTGDAGLYNVTITALGETDGECSFRLLVNGVAIGTKQNTRVTTDYGPQYHTFNNVTIPAGATLGVESNNVSNGLIPENGGFAYARGRWTTLSLVASTSTGVPVANAGPDKVITLPTTTVTLNGTGTDDDGTIASYAWTQVSGPGTAGLSGQNTANLTASGLSAGTYNFRLTVTDDQAKTHSDEVYVTVIPVGGIPVLISGELKRWHDVVLTLDGPSTNEAATPNPFYDYQFDVIFTHPGTGLSYRTPGYFAADGDAANTSATAGNKWRAHLCPDETGTWNYQIVMRSGTNAAINGPDSGTPVSPYHGATGSFVIAETDKTAPDFRARGRLQYVNKHHLRFKGDSTYFIKAGADSPENLLAYDDIDNTPNTNSRRKSWAPHQQDYVAGDPSWAGGKGTELVGAVNYLASEGLNVMSFLTYSYNGDDKNVFPHRTAGDYNRMDCSKLDQWEVIFAHAQTKGIYLHFKTQETENDQNLDGGDLGNQRKLYYRELVARYGHHLALNWNLGEENTNTDAQRKAFAQWFYDNDPYRHHVVVHTFPGEKDLVYTPLLGNASKITGASIQTGKTSVFADTRTWRTNSAGTPRPWVIANDEQGPANEGIKADSNDAAHNAERGDVLWGNIMAGGAGIESYFGYQQPETDLDLQNFRSRDLWWDQCRFALEFLNDNAVPYWNMINSDNLVSGSGNNLNHCLAQAGQTYVVYLRNGGTHTLNLSAASGTFAVKWYNPRTGGALVSGPNVSGGGTVSLGAPPNTTTSDWVALVQSTTGGGITNTAPSVSAGSDKTGSMTGLSVNVTLNGTVFDDGLPEGSSITSGWSFISGPAAVSFANASSATTAATFSANGVYVLRLTASDGEFTSSDDVQVTISPPANNLTFTTIHDAYLQNGTRFNDVDLRVEKTASRTRSVYLQFDLTSLSIVPSAATLRLTENSDVSSGTMTLRVFAASSNNWTQTTIDGTNAPAKGAELGSFTGNITNDMVVNFNLAPIITGPGIYSFIVEADTSTLDVAFAAKENSSGQGPKLLVTLPNDPPVFASYQTAAIVSGSLEIPYASILANASDPDGDTVNLIEQSENTTQGGDVQMSAGMLTYNAPVDYLGMDTFLLTVSDGKGGLAQANLMVNLVDRSTAIGTRSPSLDQLPGGNHQLGFQGIPHLAYLVQRSIELGAWETIATATADSAGVVRFTDPEPPAGKAFYRLAVP